MSNLHELEQRVASLEKEMSQLKRNSSEENASNDNWIEQLVGSFKHGPEFDEIVRLGREYRRVQTVEKEESEA